MSEARPRLLLLGDTLNLGGTEGQFTEVACGLDRGRWDLEVACVRAEGPLRPRLERAGLQPSTVGPASFKSPALGLAILRLAAHLQRHSVRLVHCFDFYSNLIGVAAARLARTPAVIASQRDMGDLRPPVQRALHRVVLRLASHVLVNSDAIATRLARLPVARRGGLAVVRNGVDAVRFAPTGHGSNGAGVTTVATLTNLRPEKGLVEFVEAAALVLRSHRRARFIIWGEGPLRTELEALIRARGVTDRVEMRGATREPDHALRECQIFVLPSLSEASSNVVLEAMATGLPVVATRVGGMAGLVDDHRTGILVPPRDPPALAEAIARLLDTPTMAEEMGSQGRTRALAEFSMGRMIERVDAFYCRALGRPPSTPVAPRPVQHA